MIRKENNVNHHSLREYYVVELGDNIVSSLERFNANIVRVDVRPKVNYHAFELKDRTEAEKIINYLNAGTIVRIVEVATTVETRFYEDPETEAK